MFKVLTKWMIPSLVEKIYGLVESKSGRWEEKLLKHSNSYKIAGETFY